ncbi:hypothetical protein L486_00678 [Kwoniella mangroviensis CBS 10435]|uniref:Major facilitator superfamily (MFS) profile domain-containing protein n=1 Tax=Kwoniella mangroviensis CBS 10435 TaxID=1331196 RepID=A0A1B9J038_9TREE|nr:hypothetical protein L486_00678 [Kwoniella mangroviensis CBS 10435]OCF74218.1 hypothetical protein I204_04588 [Kwoniella mangroviensis CBS 8886]
MSEIDKARPLTGEKVVDDIIVNEVIDVVPTPLHDDVSIWKYITLNRRAFGFSVYILMLMVGYGFDGLLTGSLVGVPSFKRHFGYYDAKSQVWVISALWQSLWTAMTSLMMVFGALTTGVLHPRFGTKILILVAMCFNAAGIITEQLSKTPADFLGAKIIAGFGFGIMTSTAIMTLPSYAPWRLRGPLGAALNTFILFGGWTAQGVLTGTGQAYPESTKAYQIPFALQYIWVIVPLCGVYWVPESASWHLRRGDETKARESLIRLHGPSRMAIVEAEWKQIMIAHRLEKTGNHQTKIAITEPFKGINLRRTLLASGLLGFQQLVGATFVTSYLTYFYQVAGTPDNLSLSLGEMSFTVQVLGNLFSWFAIDKLGRRYCLVGGLASMTLTLLIIGITWAIRSSASLWCMVAFMTVWAFLYQASIGACGFSLAAEAPGPRLRSLTIGIAQGVAQVCAWAMGFATPYMINPDEGNLGGYVGFVFAGICGAATVWSFFAVPETKGRTLAEMEVMWETQVPPRLWKRHEVNSTAAQLSTIPTLV